MYENAITSIELCTEKSIIYVLHKYMYIYFGNLLITLSLEMTVCDGCIMLGNRNHIYGR